MFSMIDRDGNGFISFRELLYAVLLFAKGITAKKSVIISQSNNQSINQSINQSMTNDDTHDMLPVVFEYDFFSFSGRL